MNAHAPLLPDRTTPAELAAHLGVNERSLRALARRLGACRELGKTMILLREDVATLMEAMRCPYTSTAAARSGTTAAPSRASDFASLQARLTASSPTGSRRKQKPTPGTVVSMDRRRM